MFDYFNKMKTYAYDVCSTLGRMASSMLNKGVELKVAHGAACTDGEKVIYLPHAMKRHLAWDEIDFVRYLVHHEYAHIQYSENKQEVINYGAGRGDGLYAHILNCLEDVRIEALASREMMMRGVYDRGRSIARRMIDKYRKERGGAWPINDCLCYLLIERTNFPDMGDESALKATGQDQLLLLEHSFKRAGILKCVEYIDEHPEDFESTRFLVPLADRIYRLLADLNPSDNIDQHNAKCDNEQGGGDDGMPSGGESADFPLSEDSLMESLNLLNLSICGQARMCDDEQWGGGMPEYAAMELNAGETLDENGETVKEERITEEDIKGKSKGLSFGALDDRRGRVPNKKDAVENYRWGLWAAGMAQSVVDKLRGMSRASYSPPKDSGIRVAQKNVPSFIRGMTMNVLKRRHRDRVRGTSVCMLIDDSGSMGDDESKNAWRSASMLCVACERAKIPTMIIRYSDGFAVEKLFNQPTSRVARRFTSAWGGGTEAYKAIEQGMMHLGLRSESRRVLFFLTDGCTEDCRKLVQQCQNDGIEFVPILFGQAAIHYAQRGGCWDTPSTIALPDTTVPLGPILVERLAATL